MLLHQRGQDLLSSIVVEPQGKVNKQTAQDAAGKRTLSVTACAVPPPPKGGGFALLTGRCQKAPPSGELAANAVSRLRGLAPQRRAFAESGAANAASGSDPSRENGIAERPQALRYPKNKNLIPLFMRKVQRRRPPPVAETGRSCWGSGQQDASAAQGTMRMLGAATR